MQRAWILLLVSGCFETRSPAGTFLSEVHVEGDQLVASSCDVVLVRDDWSRREPQLEVSNCQPQHAQFPRDTPAALFAPAPCRDAIEDWQNVATASPDQRERVWRAISPSCRHLIAGDVP